MAYFSQYAMSQGFDDPNWETKANLVQSKQLIQEYPEAIGEQPPAKTHKIVLQSKLN